jgi:DMSO/TMAO reductase YedYZ molybdopterin-dependent catalytic subunit
MKRATRAVGGVDRGRRQFLRVVTAAGLGGLSLPALLCGQAKAPSAASLVQGKDARLIVHTKGPVVLETPLSLLDGQAITPLDRLFVRNNQELKDSNTLKPIPLAGWKVELTGLIDKKVTLDAAEVAKLPLVEREMILQCSGNSRSLFAKAAPVQGTPWGKGGVGNVKFAGVPLSAVLEKYGVKVDKAARFVTAEGADPPQPGKADFEHSLPLDEVLNKTILAVRLNGEPLPAVHGGPVRLVTPGYYGTMQMKWLSRLRFEKEESTNHFQIPQYRTPKQRIKPGEKFDFTYSNSNPSWRMKVNSFILSPADGATVPANQDLEVRGVAFNDGEAAIDRVEVSVDGGRTWSRTFLQKPTSPYGWTRWSVRISFEAGRYPLRARATDARGRTQPMDGVLDWNPHGYEWNGVDALTLVVR